MSHQGHAVYEDFVDVEHHDGGDDEEEEGDHSWGEQGEMMYWWMPYHPKIYLPNDVLSSNWDAWNALKRSWNSSNACTSSSLERNTGRLLSGLAVTLIALPKAARKDKNCRQTTMMASPPRLIVSTVGNKNLMEPIENKNEEHTSYLDIPLEVSRMASHFVDSADHARSFMSEVQVDFVIYDGKRGNSTVPTLALQFPDILVHDSNSDNYYGVAF
jgi:hypothetical protein